MRILKSRIKMAQRTQSVYPEGTTVISCTLFQEWCEYWHLILNLPVTDIYMEKQQQQNTNIPPLSRPQRDIGFCNRKVSFHFQCHFLIRSNLMTTILHAHRHAPPGKKINLQWFCSVKAWHTTLELNRSSTNITDGYQLETTMPVYKHSEIVCLWCPQ